MPRLLLGLSAQTNLDCDARANQLSSSGLIFLLNSSNGAPLASPRRHQEKAKKKAGISRPFEACSAK
jgi:hypothetical protein